MYRVLWRHKRCLFVIACGCLVLIYPLILLSASETAPIVCDVGSKLRAHLQTIAKTCLGILYKHKITHFACYATLWGALRNEKLLTWQNKFTLCILNEDLKMDEVYLRRQFRKSGLDLIYDASVGIYKVTDVRQPTLGHIELVVFELSLAENSNLPLDAAKLRRIGWKHRILPPDSESLDSFPQRLVSPPLPKIKIEGLEVPAPRETIEIQKYHYRDSWWTDRRPLGC